MSSENFVRLLAGFMTLLSVTLVHFVSPWWLLLTAFIGMNLIQSVFTGFCPPIFLLTKLGRIDAAGVIHWDGQNKSS
jgi:hypothetical protein